jgi:hypothetical protein
VVAAAGVHGVRANVCSRHCETTGQST